MRLICSSARRHSRSQRRCGPWLIALAAAVAGRAAGHRGAPGAPGDRAASRGALVAATLARRALGRDARGHSRPLLGGVRGPLGQRRWSFAAADRGSAPRAAAAAASDATSSARWRSRARARSSPGRRRRLVPSTRTRLKLDPTATRLASGIELAAPLCPADSEKKIVLVTDGNETVGDARRAAALARESDARVYVGGAGSRP